MLPDQPTPKTERTCPKCGLVFASDKLGGLCPSCLLANTLDFDDTDEGPAFWEEAAPGPKTMPKRAFSHFEILDELGRGGMGVVYRARDLNTERILALKVLQAHHLEVPDLVLRFRSEVRAVSSLDHPHVLPIHEVGEHDGIPFFSMKLTTGGSLAHCIGNYLGKPREAARLLAKVARGVQHAHERGILHRDLKPGNILLDAAGEPYVCDFGLAKWLEDDRKLTVTAAVLGTPHYIAPEQAHGNKGLTTAVDIYSLGAILYELLTGRPPFVGGTVLETLVASQEKTPDRPSSIAKNVPRDLETICLKALQLEPSARYATAGAFADDLESYLAGRPIQARPVGAAEQLWRWARRNPLPATLVAALVLALVAIAAGSTVAAVRINQARSRALAAQDVAREKLYESLLTQAKASRLSGRSGQRENALEACKQAARIHPSLAVRNETIAALALTDLIPLATYEIRDSGGNRISFLDTVDSVYVADKQSAVVERNLATGALREVLPPQPRGITQILSAGGTIALRYDDASVRVWSAKTRQPLLTVLGLAETGRASWALADTVLDPTGACIAVAAAGEAVVYEIDSAKPIFRVQISDPIECIALTPGATRVAVATSAGAVRIFDVRTGAELSDLRLPAVPRCIAWNPSGEEIAVGSSDYNIYITAVSGGEMRTLRGHRQKITQVLYSHSGAFLVSTAQDRSVILWDVDSLSEQVALSGCGSEPVLRFSSDDNRLALSDFARSALITEIRHSREIVTAHTSHVAQDWAPLVSSLDFSQDSRFVAAASAEEVRIWDARAQVLRGQYRTAAATEQNVRFLPNSHTALVASRKGGLHLIRVGERTLQVERLDIAGAPENAILGSNTGPVSPITLSCAATGEIAWDGTTALTKLNHLTVGTSVWDVVAPSSLAWIAASYARQDVEILSPQTGKTVRKLDSGASSTLTLSPSDRWLVTTGEKGCIIWDTIDWRPGAALEETLRKNGNLAAFSPDSKLLAVSVGDRVFLVSMPDARTVAILESRNLPSQNYRLRFSPDGELLATQGYDNSLRFWNTRALRTALQRLNLDW
ncbi:hypothetical protein DB347_10155 [Opitutaceae bacterium EW11]|nr:hypothetical protein DB347_10155 [Opitutaceae bacterium EW11]